MPAIHFPTCSRPVPARPGLSETLLLAVCLSLAAALPAAGADYDLDGVPDQRDICPRLPNAPDATGKQPDVCSVRRGGGGATFVYLQARTFSPPQGLDQRLVGSADRRRAYLHVRGADRGVPLGQKQREALAAADVRLGRYLPENTYIVSVPATPAALRRIVALPFVTGLSAVLPDDRIARALRRDRAAGVERDASGRIPLTVDFDEATTDAEVAAALAAAGAEETAADAEERQILVKDYDAVLKLAATDAVAWIDETPGAFASHDDLSRSETWTDVVERVEGYDGADLHVAMVEANPLPLPPDQHPDLTERIVRLNCIGPVEFCPEETRDHNLGVAGTLLGDGTLDPTKRGILPASILFTLNDAFPHTNRHRWFRYPKSARDDGEAVVLNYSVGSELNCNHIGDYRSDAKQLDKAVTRFGIPIVRAAGNARGEDGDYALDPHDPDPVIAAQAPKHGPCRTNVASLPGPVAKNDIAVGNWDLAEDDISGQSSIGPTEDGRLKPDLVAPGIGLFAPSFDGGVYGYGAFDGTSAAAPVVSGVVGEVMQAFRDGAVTRDPLTVPPASVKAILIHTARDVGPWGPDYLTGWGRVDAAAAVRVALNHSNYLHEDRLTLAQPVKTWQFDVAGTVLGFKVTLAWDDPHASAGASTTLINDLDLVVTDPTGAQSYFPLDSALSASPTMAELRRGASRCLNALCRDDRNTVEQVLVSDPSGASLPTGLWTATVTGNPLAEPDQPFSLVATPDGCPLRVFDDATLSAAVSCPYEPLEPVAVSLEADGVEFDCDDLAITGGGANVDGFSGAYAGVRSLRDDTAVRRCAISAFDVGIDFAGNTRGTIEDNVIDQVGTAGIRVSGSSHAIGGNEVSAVRKAGGAGIAASGTAHAITTNTITPNPSGRDRASGITVAGAGAGFDITGNHVVTGVDGIVVTSDLQTPIDAMTVQGNGIGPVAGDGIRLTGPVMNSTVAANEIEGFGIDAAAIRLQPADALDSAPQNNAVTFNRIVGASVPTQTGVRLEGKRFSDVDDPTVVIDVRPTGNRVSGHLFVQGVGVGVSEELGEDNQIFGNVLPATAIGIQTTSSLGDPGGFHIFANIVQDAPTGITLAGPSRATVAANFVTGANVGIAANLVSGETARINGNRIRITGAGTGVSVAASQGVTVLGNNIASGDPLNPSGNGINASGTSGLALTGNTLTNLSTAIGSAGNPDAAIARNTVANATTIGISASGDRVAITDNDLSAVPQTAIGFLGGEGARIEANDIAQVTPGLTGIAVSGKPGLEVERLTISGQTVGNFATAVAIGAGVTSFTLEDSVLSATDRALDAGGAIDLDEADVSIVNTSFAGAAFDADFREPVETSGNTWSEVPLMDIVDGDGDGDGDCGSDFAFSSTDYTGTGASPALTSVKTSQVYDDAPRVAAPGACPP